MPAKFPVMSCRDLEQWVLLLQGAIEGARVNRVFVPSFPVHPDGFQKRTFVLELSTPSHALQLSISLRSGECGAVLLPHKTLRPAPEAPRSGFELALAKHLSGSRLESIRQVPGDRVLLLEFSGTDPHLLVLRLIPGKPSGALLNSPPGWSVLQSTDLKTDFLTPTARTLSSAELERIPLHSEWSSSIESYALLWRNAELQSHLKLRLHAALKRCTGEVQSIEQKLLSLRTQLDSTQNEPDWARFGNLLQIHLHENPVAREGHYELVDPSTGENVSLPAHPKLNSREQLNRYFHQAKRKKKRLSETLSRMEELKVRLDRTLKTQQELLESHTLNDLVPLENSLGIRAEIPKQEERKFADFSGRTYCSKEGLWILSGRNQAENQMLTFKIARGNDLWLHVKGRPGSHTVILLPPKRSASLETLLDAAHLCILHSGGRDWGKTEIDYTLRKYVKKIKNHSEVSYTQNKTLSVVLDEARVKKLQEALTGI